MKLRRMRSSSSEPTRSISDSKRLARRVDLLRRAPRARAAATSAARLGVRLRELVAQRELEVALRAACAPASPCGRVVPSRAGIELRLEHLDQQARVQRILARASPPCTPARTARRSAAGTCSSRAASRPGASRAPARRIRRLKPSFSASPRQMRSNAFWNASLHRVDVDVAAARRHRPRSPGCRCRCRRAPSRTDARTGSCSPMFSIIGSASDSAMCEPKRNSLKRSVPSTLLARAVQRQADVVAARAAPRRPRRRSPRSTA